MRRYERKINGARRVPSVESPPTVIDATGVYVTMNR